MSNLDATGCARPGPARSYDFSRWESGLERSLTNLEPPERQEVRTVAADGQHIRDFLGELSRGTVQLIVKNLVPEILSSLSHFEAFEAFFEASHEEQLKPQVVWGLFHVTIRVRYYFLATAVTSAEMPQLAADLPEVIGRVSDMIRRLGHKLELFNACSGGSGRPAQMKDAALDVNLELVSFLAVLVRFLRRDAPSGMNELSPNP